MEENLLMSGILRKCKDCGLEGCYDNLDLFVKSRASSHGRQNLCKQCSSLRSLEWYCSNKESAKAYGKVWKELNKQRKSAVDKVWREKNPDKRADLLRKWKLENPYKVRATNAKRRAMKLDQTPELTSEEKQRVDNLYWLAKDLQAVSGEEYHVDHIIPLAKGGLHHPDNLQVLPAYINLSKGDKIESLRTITHG
jgi:hypothetical protein